MLKWLMIILLLPGSMLQAADWHVNSVSGNDSSDGTSDRPFATIQKAINCAAEGDVIHLHPAGAVYHQSANFSGRSGITIEGNRVTLDGSDPLPATGWETVSKDLFRRRMPVTLWYRHLLIIDGRMERMGRTQSSNSPEFPAVSELKPGQFRFENINDKEGWLYVCGPVENLSWSTRGNGIGTGGTCRNLTVKNLNARYFLNDGFNIHGDARQLEFENITGYDCFDEGFSAHDTCECSITNGRFYGNENGIADVNSAETVYRRCEFYGNVNTDVLLIGKTHSLIDCRIENSTQAAALVAGPRSKEQSFELLLQKVVVVTKNRTEPARIRVNGGTLTIRDSVFDNAAFIPLGSTLKASDLRLNGSAYAAE